MDEKRKELFRKGQEYYDRQEYQKAIEYWEKAAAAGSTAAMIQLGILYDTGTGVSRNWDKTMEWFQKAADSGDAVGVYNIGVLYENGHAGPATWPRQGSIMKKHPKWDMRKRRMFLQRSLIKNIK